MVKKLIKNKWRLLLLLYIMFIIHGTSLPYDFTLEKEVVWNNLQRLLGVLHGAPIFPAHSDSDVIANILFFIPLGFLISLVYYKESEGGAFSFLIKAGLSGFLLSLFVETVQIFTFVRNSSLSDLITNTSGSIIGAGAGLLFLRKGYHDRTVRLAQKLINDPALFLLISYMSVIILIGLLPYDFNISLYALSRKIRSLVHIEYHPIRRPVVLFNLIFLYGSGGYIFARFTHIKLKSLSYNKAFILAIASGFLFCFGVEMMQLFVNSRHFSWMDVFVGWLGILYGAYGYLALHSAWIKKAFPKYERNDILFIFFTVNYFIFLVYKYLYPFHLSTDEIFVTNRIVFFLSNVLSYAPSQRIMELMIILLKNIALFVPAGIILAESRFISLKRERFLGVFIVLLFLAKSLQIINIQQTPLLFDFLGILIGMTGGYFIWMDFRQFILFTK